MARKRGVRKTLLIDLRKNYPRCVAIIDRFEIFIDRPSDLLAQAQTYSSYKHLRLHRRERSI